AASGEKSFCPVELFFRSSGGGPGGREIGHQREQRRRIKHPTESLLLGCQRSLGWFGQCNAHCGTLGRRHFQRVLLRFFRWRGRSFGCRRSSPCGMPEEKPSRTGADEQADDESKKRSIHGALIGIGWGVGERGEMGKRKLERILELAGSHGRGVFRVQD